MTEKKQTLLYSSPNTQKDIYQTIKLSLSLRIRHAITLLNDETNTLSIREIGEHCGFGTEASFHRIFKKSPAKPQPTSESEQKAENKV